MIRSVASILALFAGFGIAYAGIFAPVAESFDTDTGAITIVNESGDSGWAFDDTCPVSQGSADGPGVLRWGRFPAAAFQGGDGTTGGACEVYGPAQGGSRDVASIPPVDVPDDGCALSFEYFLEFEEPVAFENADVLVSVGGAPPTTLGSLATGELLNDATWRGQSLDLPAGPVAVEFVGSTADGSFNTGAGWVIDDVRIECGATPLCKGLVPTIVGTNGDDIINGTQGPDVIVGLAGNDKINGLGGDDVICGNAGADRLIGGKGDDWLFGGLDVDSIYGQGGSDYLAGGPGNDFLSGGAHADVIFGGDGEDHLLGQGGDDELHGNEESDRLVGGAGFDLLDGGPDEDTCLDARDSDFQNCELDAGCPPTFLGICTAFEAVPRPARGAR